MIEKINALRSFVKEDLGDVKEYYIFRTENLEGKEQFGVIMLSQDVEHLDEHCDKCRDEILGFKIPGPEEVPKYLWILVGPTKFARIKSGWRDSRGVDLRRATDFFLQEVE